MTTRSNAQRRDDAEDRRRLEVVSVSEETSSRMAATRARDNPRERRIRSALHRRGLRFRIHYAAPGITRRSIDIAFPRAKLAVFCDGCFWHGCPVHGTTPKSNRSWWLEKIQTNVRRDANTDARLRDAGWQVLRLWEHLSDEDAVESVLRCLDRCPRA